jgi:MFS family permease
MLFYRSLGLNLAGMALLGSACSFIFVPLLPEIINSVMDKEEIGENEELNDKGASVFNFSYALGCLIAPILGGAFNDIMGFRYTSDLMAVCACVFGLLYFFVNLLPYLLDRRAKRRYSLQLETQDPSMRPAMNDAITESLQ